MSLLDLDALLRAAIFALAMAGAAVILVRSHAGPAARLAAFIVGGLGAFAAASAPGALRVLGWPALVFDAWCLATPAVVWMLALALFRDEPLPRAAIAVPVCLVAIVLPADFGRFQLGLLADWPGAATWIVRAGRVVSIALVLAACIVALRHWRADLVEPRRRLRAIFVATLGVAFIAMAASEFVFGGRGAPIEVLVPAHGLLAILAFAIVVAAAAHTPEAAARRASPMPLKVVPGGAAQAALAQRVLEAMRTRELWKRERLSIRELAEELGDPEYRVRRAINRHLGYRNFNDFLHEFRLDAAAARLRDPAQARLPVLSIALDCGYGSIGPFNRAFKSRFGVTPSQWRNEMAARCGLPQPQPRSDSGIG